MDLSSVLAYKSMFFCTRAKNTADQLKDGKNCTALVNGARCAITTAQGVLPLYAVSDCLSKTSSNPTVSRIANNIASSRLKDIAISISGGTTNEAVKGISSTIGFLNKLGLAGNIAYATAKCIDAKEEEKTKVFMQASGNCAGMYLFENIYSHIVDKINPDEINKYSKSINTLLSKLPVLNKVKVSSILFAIGFVCASLYGCKIGELFGESLCKQEQNI